MSTARDLARFARRSANAISNVANTPGPLGGSVNPKRALENLRGDGLQGAVRDRITLVTGASSGIGAATAVRIGRAGGEVILVARGADGLNETAAAVREAGGTAHVHPCDLSDMVALDELGHDVLEQHGRVDILVNNAGRSIRRSLALSYDRFHDFERTMGLNYFAPVRLMLILLPGMRERRFGQVVNISTAGVQTRVPRFGAYIASKAALDTLCDSWQAETTTENVRFTTVHMVLVRTPMIAPTKIYRRFPSLSPDQAAGVICDAIVHRPRRVSPPVGQLASFADAVTPGIMDRVRHEGFRAFGDTAAARGTKRSKADETLTREGRALAEIFRGVHW